jgi:diguanylate cyclase (GGDEF)-like protein
LKTRAITELFKESTLPVALLDENEPEWHNSAFEALDTANRDTLLAWATQASTGDSHFCEGLRFELLTASRHRLLVATIQASNDSTRRLIRELLPALAEAGDPWLNTARVLGPLLHWENLAAVKHKSATADDLLGHWRADQLRPPRHLPLKEASLQTLYAGNQDSRLLTLPAQDNPNDPLLAGDNPEYLLAQRVDHDSGQPAGYLAVWGNPNSDALVQAAQLMPLAADMLAYQLKCQSHAPPEQEPEIPEYPADDLTGLPGRAAFDTTLEAFESHYQHYQQDCLMAMLDINSLSSINNTRGIEFGDTLLRRFAEKLRHICRPEDRVFRFGGDEFVVLMPYRQDPPPLQKRLDSICDHFQKEPELAAFSISSGIASLGEAKGSSDDLMLLSDQRLRNAKSARLISNR